MIRFRGFGPGFYLILVSLLLLFQSLSRADGDAHSLWQQAVVKALEISWGHRWNLLDPNLSMTPEWKGGAKFPELEQENLNRVGMMPKCPSVAWGLADVPVPDPVANAKMKASEPFCFKVWNVQKNKKQGDLECRGVYYLPDKSWFDQNTPKLADEVRTATGNPLPKVCQFAANCKFHQHMDWKLDNREPLSGSKPNLSASGLECYQDESSALLVRPAVGSGGDSNESAN